MFSDDSCSCIVISDEIYVMALRADRFADFVAGPVGDARQATTVINCLSAESRAEVDALVAKALAGGGQPWLDKMEDGPMYGHSFADPDGHAWEVLYMEMPRPPLTFPSSRSNLADGDTDRLEGSKM